MATFPTFDEFYRPELERKIKASVRQKVAACTNPEARQKYLTFVTQVTGGIRSTQGLFQQISDRIRHIVQPVVDWIRNGLTWLANVVTDALKTIRDFF